MEVLHYQGSFQTPLKGFETQASTPSTVTKYLLGNESPVSPSLGNRQPTRTQVSTSGRPQGEEVALEWQLKGLSGNSLTPMLFY